LFKNSFFIISLVQFFVFSNIGGNGGGMKLWGLRATFLSSYTGYTAPTCATHTGVVVPLIPEQSVPPVPIDVVPLIPEQLVPLIPEQLVPPVPELLCH